MQGVAELGTRWCEIIKASPLIGRTDNAIKNRFYSLQRRMKSLHAAGAAAHQKSGGKETDSPLGKRRHSADVLAATQRERIMNIATDLAFAVDEGERDRLILSLAATLHEGGEEDDADGEVTSTTESLDASDRSSSPTSTSNSREPAGRTRGRGVRRRRRRETGRQQLYAGWLHVQFGQNCNKRIA